MLVEWSVFRLNGRRHRTIWVLILPKVEFGNDTEGGRWDNALVNLWDCKSRRKAGAVVVLCWWRCVFLQIKEKMNSQGGSKDQIIICSLTWFAKRAAKRIWASGEGVVERWSWWDHGVSFFFRGKNYEASLAQKTTRGNGKVVWRKFKGHFEKQALVKKIGCKISLKLKITAQNQATNLGER